MPNESTCTTPDGDAGNDRNAVEEIQITTESTYAFMSVLQGTEYELLVLLVTERESTNLGLGWMALRNALDVVRNAQGNGASNTPGDGQHASADTLSPLFTRRRGPERSNLRSQGRRAIWDHR